MCATANPGFTTAILGTPCLNFFYASARVCVSVCVRVLCVLNLVVCTLPWTAQVLPVDLPGHNCYRGKSRNALTFMNGV